MENLGNASSPAAEANSIADSLSSGMQDDSKTIQASSENAKPDGEGQKLSTESEVDAAVKKGEITKKQATDLKKKFQLKVDGQSEELELDLGNEEEVKKYLQKARSFDKRSKEYAGFKSQVDSFINQLKSSPDSILEQLGINVDEFAEKRIQRKIEEMSKSPEQIEAEKMRAELEQLRKEKDEAKKTAEKAEQEAVLKKTVAEIESGIIKALDSTSSKLPKGNPLVIGEIAKAMKEAMNRGYNEVTVEDVVPIVEKKYMQMVKSLFDVLPEELIESYMGQNNVDRLKKKRMAKAAPMTANRIATDTGESTKARAVAEAKPAKKMSYSEFFKK